MPCNLTVPVNVSDGNGFVFVAFQSTSMTRDLRDHRSKLLSFGIGDHNVCDTVFDAETLILVVVVGEKLES